MSFSRLSTNTVLASLPRLVVLHRYSSAEISSPKGSIAPKDETDSEKLDKLIADVKHLEFSVRSLKERSKWHSMLLISMVWVLYFVLMPVWQPRRA